MYLTMVAAYKVLSYFYKILAAEIIGPAFAWPAGPAAMPMHLPSLATPTCIARDWCLSTVENSAKQVCIMHKHCSIFAMV